MADQPPTTSVGGVQYRVTPEYLAGASTNTARTAGEIANSLQEIKSYVLSLESHWQGIAHNQFQTLMQEYDIYARMLNDALMGISKGLQGNYANYKESESQNLSNLSSLGADIPKGSGGGQFPGTNDSAGTNFS